jgi:hypothetical protein
MPDPPHLHLITFKKNIICLFDFWYITPCMPLKIIQRFGGTCRVHLQGPRISQVRYRPAFLVSYLPYSSTLKMKEACSPQRSAGFQMTILRCIPEDRTIRNNCCWDLKLCTGPSQHGMASLNMRM